MAIPAYLWLKDEGRLEIVALKHTLHIPTDNKTGRLTGTGVIAVPVTRASLSFCLTDRFI